jgi:isopenicillin N synthase-like dioxygenase
VEGSPNDLHFLVNRFKFEIRQPVWMCSSTVEEYKNEASRLSHLLLELMAGSLGLPEGSVQEFLGYGPESQGIARLGVNHYPACPQPELTWGLHAHTDPSVLTLLHQDEVGGLEIRLNNKTWHGVRPIPEAFVINAGDFCQVGT